MGVIVSLADDVDLDTALIQFAAILDRVQDVPQSPVPAPLALRIADEVQVQARHVPGAEALAGRALELEQNGVFRQTIGAVAAENLTHFFQSLATRIISALILPLSTVRSKSAISSLTASSSSRSRTAFGSTASSMGVRS